MANQVYLNSMCLGVMLLGISFYSVEGDVTLQASASQSHPMEGRSTALTCEVRSMNQSHVLIWSKDQRFITWGDTMGQMMSSRFELFTNSVSENLTTSMLIINDITRDDDGRYQCQVLEVGGNGYSAMASETVILSVLYFPTDDYPYCSLNGSQTLLAETKLAVTCISEVGNPQISSMWTVADDAAVPLVYHTAESSSMMVSVLDLTASHDLQGVTYVCDVTSPAYPEFDRTCSLGPLRILDWPIVTITRSVPSVSEGNDVYFVCNTEPRMPNLKWVTNPNIDPERLVMTEGGSILTVKDVRLGDNATDVVCQVPYRDTQVEARSTILLDEPTRIIAPSLYATPELCMPWFGAFLLTVAINFILCVIIVRLLIKVKKLGCKSRTVKSDADSLKDINTEMSNWSMGAEKQLRDQRSKSWQCILPVDDENNPLEREYTELSPDTRTKARKKQRKTVSLPGISLMDSDSYVTPSNHSNFERDLRRVTKATSSSHVKATRKTGLTSVLVNPTKTSTAKSSNIPNKGHIKTISRRMSTGQSRTVKTDSYEDLNEKASYPLPQKTTYQSLRKTPNSSRYASKPVALSLKKKRTSSAKKPGAADKDEMTGDSGIYGERGSYMTHGDGDMASDETDRSTLAKRQGSMMAESASYMPAGTIQNRHTLALIHHHRSGTLSSESSVDANENRYESPPETPVYSTGTDDDMVEAIYAKSFSGKRGQSRGTVSSRAPMPNPIAGDQQDLDPLSSDESYKEPYLAKRGDNQVYLTLEPGQSYNNYGADISSANESHQGAESFDWDPAQKTASQKCPPARQNSSTSGTSYLELGDAEGEIKGYIDMAKTKPIQHKAPPKVTKQTSLTDSERSSSEYYQSMEGASRNYKYAIPHSNPLTN